ncbi:hypothetical protein [Pseudomonas aeruginosa]|uniref:hypothetical protein n=1 Tax=Pseudomonas aeruginosa TaxID=287 RepID=UPI0012FE0544|nr:hypothetical protein [Pseudomonas aeruginosa]
MFYDYLTVEQVYPYPLPKVSDTGICYYDRRTGETLRDTAPGWKHEGSYSTLIKIRVDGCKLRVEGNPSAVNRLDNLDGYRSLDDCIAVSTKSFLSTATSTVFGGCHDSRSALSGGFARVMTARSPAWSATVRVFGVST